jgi:NAD(P)-dependent dehydrogenase (short-subunit alcohol dehydrogenase family)
MPPLGGGLVVVTGGGGGLGRAVVEDLAGRGARVVVAERRPPRDGSLPPGVEHRIVDATDEASVSALFAGLPDAPLGLVNVIGGYAAGPSIADMEIATLEQQLAQNLVSATVLTKWATRRMTPAGVGRIVHVASRAARESGAHAFAYSVSKLGVVRLVEAAAEESRDLGITCNCVLPSTIDTPANRAAMADADFARWVKPAQIAKVIAFLLSDDAEIVSGAAVPVYGRA